MSINKIFAIALILLGAMGLIYGGFSFTRDTHKADLGPLSLSIDEKEYVTVPIWAGIAGIAIGGALLLFSKKG